MVAAERGISRRSTQPRLLRSPFPPTRKPLCRWEVLFTLDGQVASHVQCSLHHRPSRQLSVTAQTVLGTATLSDGSYQGGGTMSYPATFVVNNLAGGIHSSPPRTQEIQRARCRPPTVPQPSWFRTTLCKPRLQPDDCMRDRAAPLPSTSFRSVAPRRPCNCLAAHCQRTSVAASLPLP